VVFCLTVAESGFTPTRRGFRTVAAVGRSSVSTSFGKAVLCRT
jgi:hypothetical protein